MVLYITKQTLTLHINYVIMILVIAGRYHLLEFSWTPLSGCYCLCHHGFKILDLPLNGSHLHACAWFSLRSDYANFDTNKFSFSKMRKSLQSLPDQVQATQRATDSRKRRANWIDNLIFHKVASFSRTTISVHGEGLHDDGNGWGRRALCFPAARPHGKEEMLMLTYFRRTAGRFSMTEGW